MAGSTAPVDSTIHSGEESFLSPAAIRQPADGLGPRAQQTIVRIVEATREVFLTRGYSGTTIDEIARIAEVSRASFYTYFPSKREVLLAVGARSASESADLIDTLSTRPGTVAGMVAFVSDYFDLLDVHGSFAFAWTQAAQEDEEIRVAGMKRHLGLCKQFGTKLAEVGGRSIDQPATVGIAAASLLERSWNYCQLYVDTVDRATLIDEAARTLLIISRDSI
jgi:AcrR family transcriptional regulator